jgi:hypothetical protein
MAFCLSDFVLILKEETTYQLLWTLIANLS